jgi:hypothetical protein
MGWQCKECGGEIRKTIDVHMSIIEEIKINKKGEIIKRKEIDSSILDTFGSYFSCGSCHNATEYGGELKDIAEYIPKRRIKC